MSEHQNERQKVCLNEQRTLYPFKLNCLHSSASLWYIFLNNQYYLLFFFLIDLFLLKNKSCYHLRVLSQTHPLLLRPYIRIEHISYSKTQIVLIILKFTILCFQSFTNFIIIFIFYLEYNRRRVWKVFVVKSGDPILTKLTLYHYLKALSY